ncbi:MAG: flagellar hook-length control protein FliK [Burkholderiaceae bacterium]|nr:flagellar hook-length control protein FliK [Burkholderiaceae bacterium]
MLRSDATGVRPVIQAELLSSTAPVSSPSQDAFNRLMAVSIGRQFQAEVMLRQNDGSFLVRIADTTARMALPEGTQSGDKVSLTLVAASPRPTFLLGETQVSATPLPGQQSAAAGLLIDTLPQDASQEGAGQIGSSGAGQIGKAAPTETATAAPLNQPANSATTSTMTSLSPTGRLIDSLLHATEQNNAPASVQGQSAIMPIPDVTPEKLAQAMHRTLENSGVFYESHVNEWVNGNRATETLMLEPQARLAASGQPLSDAEQLSQLATLNNETAQLIRTQLDSLENRRFVWQGELWPGQRFEWEVSDETPQRQQQTDASVSAWRSVVRFELPTLGAITASINLAGGHVQVQLRTATDTAAETIRPYAGELASALDAAGAPLDLLTVRKDEFA